MQKILLPFLVLFTNKAHSERSSPYTNFSDILIHQLLFKNPKSTECVSESGDFATLFFLVRQHWGGRRYRHFALTLR